MADISMWYAPLGYNNDFECAEDLDYFGNLNFNIPASLDYILDDSKVFIPMSSSSKQPLSSGPASSGPSFLTPGARWSAVSRRDHSAATAFVYAVMTTKIYCRPTCPARLARRANVTFFDTPALAEAGGYRACKRCKPEKPAETVDEEGNVKQKVKQAVEIVVEAAGRGEKVGLKELSNRLGVSKWHLQRVFKKMQGISPNEMGKLYTTEASTSRIVGLPAANLQQGVSEEVPGAIMSSTDSPTTWGVTTNAPTPMNIDVPTPTGMEMPELPWSLQSNPSESSEESFIDPGSWTNMLNDNPEDMQVEATLKDLFPELYDDGGQ